MNSMSGYGTLPEIVEIVMSQSLVYGGADVGGTNIAAAVSDGEGRILAETSVATLPYEGPAGVLRRVGEALQHLSEQANGTLMAIGVGLPGLIDLQRGETLFLPNFPGNWRNVPARLILEEQLQVPVALLNDARIATLGELRYGLGRGVNTMVYLTLGTGIGGGLVVDGRLRLGALGAAGELGHQTILPEGPPCGCGNRGCVETLASGPAITAEGVRLLKSGLAPILYELTEGDASRVTPKEMAAACLAGDKMVQEAIRRAAVYLGIAIANVVTILHPELVVLTGGVAAMGDLLLTTIREEVKRRVGMFPAETARIEVSSLANRAGVLGGVALALDQYKQTRDAAEKHVYGTALL
jgi:glucokinase